MENNIKDWKLKLRYGLLKTNYKHFTVLADGVAGDLTDGFECPNGRAWMGIKVWATNADESTDMIKLIGNDIGFSVDGEILVYATEPEQPPGETPSGYDIKLTPYKI